MGKFGTIIAITIVIVSLIYVNMKIEEAEEASLFTCEVISLETETMSIKEVSYRYPNIMNDELLSNINTDFASISKLGNTSILALPLR